MKKIFVLTLSGLISLTLLAFGISAERTLPLVVDSADLLTSSEEASLEALLTEISDKHQIEIAVVTVNSTNGKSAESYADDFYDYNGYGWGENYDGALLLIDIGSREWHITTHGAGAYYLDDYSLYEIEEAFINDLSSGWYYDAFTTFASKCDFYIENDEVSAVSFILPSIIVGFIISLIVVSVMKSGMKTVRPASGAADYMVRDSLNLRMSSDRYLYTNVVRTRKQSSSNGSSSMHRSSSGRSHGGRGGRF